MTVRPAGNKSSQLRSQAECIDQDLSAIRRALRKPLDAEVSRGGLTVPQTAVMSAAVRSDGISLKDLSLKVSLAHSTVSGIVDRLEKRGMLERRPDPLDGRATRIYPTRAVKNFLHHRLPKLSAVGPLQAALALISAEERETLAGAIKRLRELLDGTTRQDGTAV